MYHIEKIDVVVVLKVFWVVTTHIQNSILLFILLKQDSRPARVAYPWPINGLSMAKKKVACAGQEMITKLGSHLGSITCGGMPSHIAKQRQARHTLLADLLQEAASRAELVAAAEKAKAGTPRVGLLTREQRRWLLDSYLPAHQWGALPAEAKAEYERRSGDPPVHKATSSVAPVVVIAPQLRPPPERPAVACAAPAAPAMPARLAIGAEVLQASPNAILRQS